MDATYIQHGSSTFTWPTSNGQLAIVGGGGPAAFAIGDIGTSVANEGMTFGDNILSLEPADETHGGVVNTTTQNFGGAKSFEDLSILRTTTDVSAPLAWKTGTTTNFVWEVPSGSSNLQCRDSSTNIYCTLPPNGPWQFFSPLRMDANYLQHGTATYTWPSANGQLALSGESVNIATNIGTTSVNAGMTFASNLLTLQPADKTHGGVMNTTTQSFGGAKTFDDLAISRNDTSTSAPLAFKTGTTTNFVWEVPSGGSNLQLRDSSTNIYATVPEGGPWTFPSRVKFDHSYVERGTATYSWPSKSGMLSVSPPSIAYYSYETTMGSPAGLVARDGFSLGQSMILNTFRTDDTSLYSNLQTMTDWSETRTIATVYMFSLQPGIYYITARSPVNTAVNENQAILYNETSKTIAIYGTNNYSTVQSTKTVSVVNGMLTVSSTSNFSLRHRVNGQPTTNVTFGRPNSFWTEKYAEVQVTLLQKL
jgi:hypothetical protein